MSALSELKLNLEITWKKIWFQDKLSHGLIRFNKWQFCKIIFKSRFHLGYLAGIYLLKVKKETLEQMCEICSKLTIKTPKRRQWHSFGVFIVNFEHI